MEKTKTINFEWDDSEFKENAEKLIKEVQNNSDQTITKVSQDWVGSAINHTPPSIGKRAIEKKYWERPILAMGKLIRNQYEGIKPTTLDYQMYHKKYNYKVLNTRRGVKPGTPIGYYKSKAEAKRAAKIETRGLARVMWGKNIADIGGVIPTSLQKIFAKAPKLLSLNYNKMEKYRDENGTTVEIENQANSVSNSTMQSAVAFADKKAENTINRLLKEFADKERKL